jgi:UDP-glucose 4-epimerase
MRARKTRVRHYLSKRYSRFLVAGGAGFIGSHIVDKLLATGADVTVLDNLFTGQRNNIAQHKHNRNFHFVKGDVRNVKEVKRILEDIDAVFNHAAVVSVRRSVENPLLVNDVNTKGALNLLQASLDNGVKRFVQASSASVYGNVRDLPVHEEMCTNPISPYAVSELAAENYATMYYQVYGLETVCLRYFNVYGPRQTYSAYSGVTTIFVNQLFQNQRPIIFGDGEQTRDFVYVQDVVSANMLALTRKDAVGDVFNIATGKETSVNKLVQTLQEVTGKTNLKPIYKEAKPGEIKRSYASIEKAEKTLGYEPAFTIEKGLQNLVEWCRNEPLQDPSRKKTKK